MSHTLPNSRGRFRLVLMACLAALIGIIAGFVAYGLYLLIAIGSNLIFYQRFGLQIPGLGNHSLGVWVAIIPIAGGLIVGLMAYFGSGKIRGHGIPEAIEAVMLSKSRIQPRVAILKPLSAAISISTGGPFGAEGPIIQTGGALGSLLGQLIRTTAAERKTLLACGAAAGMAATFGTPIAGVIFAIELLLFEFRTRSFIPLVIASTLATTVHYHLLGNGPMFEVGSMEFEIASGLPFYLLLGMICGLGAVALSRALYWVEDQFERLPINPLWWPAIGGVALGLIALLEPRVLGVGYDLISDILHSRLTLLALLAICLLKSLALLLSLGSGTSGGLLAPSFIIGAALGSAFAITVNAIVPSLHLDPAAYALVAMAAMFAAASRATFAFIIFAFEITRNYDAMLPLMLTGVTASLLTYKLQQHSIMTEKLARRGLKVHQDYEVDVLQQYSVGDVMDPAPVTLAADMSIDALLTRLDARDPAMLQHQAWPLTDASGRLRGIISRSDLLRSLEHTGAQRQSLLEAGSDDLVVAFPDEPLHDAVNRMLDFDVGRLLVVDRESPETLLGYLGRGPIIRTRQARREDEILQEGGWLSHRPGS